MDIRKNHCAFGEYVLLHVHSYSIANPNRKNIKTSFIFNNLFE